MFSVYTINVNFLLMSISLFYLLSVSLRLLDINIVKMSIVNAIVIFQTVVRVSACLPILRRNYEFIIFLSCISKNCQFVVSEIR